jgi:hypothetical protein
MSTDGYEIRNFTEGDEKEIINLFNETYKKYGGHVQRTANYWRWCCLKRPDVKKDGIFLVFGKETENLEGYAVVGTSGNIWEFCYRFQPNGELVASILLKASLSYLKNIGCSSIKLNVPHDCETLHKICRKFGFTRFQTVKIFVGILNLEQFFFELITSQKEELNKRFREKITLKIDESPFWIENAISIEINDGKISIDKGSRRRPTILARTDIMTLCYILFGFLNPYRALLSLKIKVRPFWKVPSLLKFFLLIRVNDPWFWPMSDWG